MSKVLSQEEIDALLSGAAGAGAAPQSEQPKPPPGGQQTRSQSQYQGEESPRGKVRNVRFGADQVVIAPATFEPLEDVDQAADQTTMELILDTELAVSAELGTAVRTVKEILELGPGSVIELNKLSGEPVDLFINGRTFSRGEVVVIAESFGIRVTDIISIEERIEALGPSS